MFLENNKFVNNQNQKHNNIKYIGQNKRSKNLNSSKKKVYQIEIPTKKRNNINMINKGVCSKCGWPGSGVAGGKVSSPCRLLVSSCTPHCPPQAVALNLTALSFLPSTPTPPIIPSPSSLLSPAPTTLHPLITFVLLPFVCHFLNKSPAGDTSSLFDCATDLVSVLS